jgi:hypothetical protein
MDFALPRPWPGDADAIKEWDRKMNPVRHKAAQNNLIDDFDAEPFAAPPHQE